MTNFPIQMPPQGQRQVGSDGKLLSTLYYFLYALFQRTGGSSGSVHSGVTEPWVNVVDFGADPTGARDSTTAIQNAINSLSPYGGTVIFPMAPAGSRTVYKITDDIIIGNGSDAGLSSNMGGIYLLGLGVPSNPLINAHNGPGVGALGGVTLRAEDNYGGNFIMQFWGVQGWGVSNILFETPDRSAKGGLNVISCSLGQCIGLSFDGFTNSDPFGGGGALVLDIFDIAAGLADCYHNTFINTFINVPPLDQANGISFFAGPAADADYATFINTTICLSASNPDVSTAILVTGGDTCTFYQTHIIGGDTNSFGILFDYTTGTPSGFTFFAIDCVAPIANNGAFGTGTPHQIYGWTEVNGAVPPLADGIVFYDSFTSRMIPVAVGDLRDPGAPGERAIVTDANATTFHSVVAAGGANKVPVFWDDSGGGDWRIG